MGTGGFPTPQRLKQPELKDDLSSPASFGLEYVEPLCFFRTIVAWHLSKGTTIAIFTNFWTLQASDAWICDVCFGFGVNYFSCLLSRLHAEYDQAMNNLANILKDEGNLHEAENLLRRAVQIR